MDDLQKLIQDALIEKWPDAKLLPDQFFKPEHEGIEEILSYNLPWSVAIVQKETDKIVVELYRHESEVELRAISAEDNQSIHRIPFQKFWAKNILNYEDKYQFEFQNAEGAAVFQYWSLSELCDQIEAAFVRHEETVNRTATR